MLDAVLGDIKHLRNTLDTTLEKHIEKDGQRFPKSLSGAAPVSLSQHNATNATAPVVRKHAKSKKERAKQEKHMSAARRLRHMAH